MGIAITEYKSTGKFACAHLPMDRDGMIIINGFPGHTKWDGRTLVVRPTGANIDHMLTCWGDAEWDERSAAIRDEYLAKKSAAAAVMEAKRTTLTDKSYPYKTPPYDHQEHAFILQRDIPSFALLMDMGTGKTKVAIDTASYLFLQGRITGVLVFAWPSGVHEVWVDDEFPAHCPVDWSGFIWTGKTTKRAQKEFATMLEGEGLKVFALNLEAVRAKTAMAWVDNFLKANKTMLIVDESIAIKNPSALGTKTMTKLGKHPNVPYRRILTGAQVSNSNADVFAQYRFLDPQIIGYDTYTSFKARYCVIYTPHNDPRRQIITGYQNIPELIAKIDPYSYRVRKEECLSLPPKVYRRLPFHLSPHEQQVYDAVRTEYTAELNGQVLTAELALVRLIRLQQIAGGWFPGDDGELAMIDQTPSRLKALLSVLSENKGKKAIIWTRFVSDVQLLVDCLNRLKPGCALGYHGSVSREQRKIARDSFQHDPHTQFLIAQFQCASRGLTLTAAEYVIYYANQYSLDMRVQSEDRAHRIDEVRMEGRASIPYIDLCAVGTIDSKIISALRAKKDVADIINNDPPGGFLEYSS